jgi:hypothetical protein
LKRKELYLPFPTYATRRDEFKELEAQVNVERGFLKFLRNLTVFAAVTGSTHNRRAEPRE